MRRQQDTDLDGGIEQNLVDAGDEQSFEGKLILASRALLAFTSIIGALSASIRIDHCSVPVNTNTE